MKIDILTLAPALLPLVPAAYKPLAAALVEEVKARRAEAAQLNAHIVALTETVNGHTAVLRGLTH